MQFISDGREIHYVIIRATANYLSNSSIHVQMKQIIQIIQRILYHAIERFILFMLETNGKLAERKLCDSYVNFQLLTIFIVYYL